MLIEGETGVGKEVAARADPRSQPPRRSAVRAGRLHRVFDRAHGIAAVRPREGRFTGAVAAALGFVRCADGGTLFLDEIGELPLSVQAKLLRRLQERIVVPSAACEPIAVNVRIIAATHRDLAAMVRDGTFRQDLYFRLNVVRLSIRPLRERRDDILPLADISCTKLPTATTSLPKSLAPAAADALIRYDWPGNVRELRNAIERAFLYCGDRTIDWPICRARFAEFTQRPRRQRQVPMDEPRVRI